MINTQRLIVRNLNDGDFHEFAALENDADVKAFVGGAYSISEDAYRRFVSVSSETCMAVCRRSDGGLVGRCGFRRSGDRIELEIFLRSDEQSKGLGGELFKAMISLCSTSFPALKITATVSPVNSRAISLLTAHGFKDSGEIVTTKFGSAHALYIQTELTRCSSRPAATN